MSLDNGALFFQREVIKMLDVRHDAPRMIILLYNKVLLISFSKSGSN